MRPTSRQREELCLCTCCCIDTATCRPCAVFDSRMDCSCKQTVGTLDFDFQPNEAQCAAALFDLDRDDPVATNFVTARAELLKKARLSRRRAIAEFLTKGEERGCAQETTAGSQGKVA